MAAVQGAARATDVVVFEVDGVACGLDILDIQEIKRIHSFTPVHRAPPHVRGLVNMRGQIVTLLDVRARLGREPRAVQPGAPAIIVARGDDLAGLVVDRVDDVVHVEPEALLPPSPNLDPAAARLCTAVLRTDDRIVALLDRERLVEAAAAARAEAS